MNQEEQYFDEIEESSGIGMAIMLVLVLIIMVTSFIWFVIRIDPWTDDFVDSNTPVATATDNPEGT